MDKSNTSMEKRDTINKIIKGVKEYFKKAGKKKAVIGLSGGIDSAVTCKLAVMALGKENIIAILMPEIGVTKRQNIDDARMFAESLGIKYIIQPINRMLIAYQFNVPINEIAYINLKARIRANILYSYTNTFDALVIGTSNKSELMMGYGTKYGDLTCDIMPSGSLLKTEVREIAKEMGIPKNIIKKTPSAELYRGQTDEKELGMSYEELDKQLCSGKIDKKIKKRIIMNKHKREPPYIIKV